MNFTNKKVYISVRLLIEIRRQIPNYITHDIQAVGKALFFFKLITIKSAKKTCVLYVQWMTHITWKLLREKYLILIIKDAIRLNEKGCV